MFIYQRIIFRGFDVKSACIKSSENNFLKQTYYTVDFFLFNLMFCINENMAELNNKNNYNKNFWDSIETTFYLSPLTSDTGAGPATPRSRRPGVSLVFSQCQGSKSHTSFVALLVHALYHFANWYRDSQAFLWRNLSFLLVQIHRELISAISASNFKSFGFFWLPHIESQEIEDGWPYESSGIIVNGHHYSFIAGIFYLFCQVQVFLSLVDVGLFYSVFGWNC